MGSRRNDDAKYTEGGGNDHLINNIYVKHMELSKYTRYIILVPRNNGNDKLTVVHGKPVSNLLAPTNCKRGCESKIDIDIDIDPSGDNRIFSNNNRSVAIDPGSLL